MLSQIAWSKDYEVTPSVDEQHQQLFALVVALQGALGTQDTAQIQEWFHCLLEFSEGHMLYEEALMLQTEYPDVECHTKSHRRILVGLLERYQGLLGGEIGPSELLTVIDNWARAHVLLEDAPCKEHFLSNKIR